MEQIAKKIGHMREIMAASGATRAAFVVVVRQPKSRIDLQDARFQRNVLQQSKDMMFNVVRFNAARIVDDIVASQPQGIPPIQTVSIQLTESQLQFSALCQEPNGYPELLRWTSPTAPTADDRISLRPGDTIEFFMLDQELTLAGWKGRVINHQTQLGYADFCNDRMTHRFKTNLHFPVHSGLAPDAWHPEDYGDSHPSDEASLFTWVKKVEAGETMDGYLEFANDVLSNERVNDAQTDEMTCGPC